MLLRRREGACCAWVDGRGPTATAQRRPMVDVHEPASSCYATQSRPLDHETSRTGRQVTGDDCQILEVESSLCLAVTSMEVGMTAMVGLVVIHPDRDPIETAYLRHPRIVRFQLSQNKTEG